MPAYTPSSNDTNTVTADFDSDQSSAATTITLSAFTAQGVSGLNPTQGFAVGSEFTIEYGGSDQFTITALTTNSVALTASATITPALTANVIAGQTITRVYKGNRASLSDQLRLRNQGQI